MTKTLSLAFLLLAAAGVGAQQPAPTGAVPLDRIVAVVGDQPITRFDLQERILQKQQNGEISQIPTDPAALMDPDDAETAFLCADIGDGRLPRWYRQDGSVERDAYLTVPDAAFEEALEAAKHAADPEGYAAAEARIAEYAQEEAEEAERRARRRRR